MSQTRQRNGILKRCAKGHRDVQNAARVAEKNATILSIYRKSRNLELWINSKLSPLNCIEFSEKEKK